MLCGYGHRSSQISPDGGLPGRIAGSGWEQSFWRLSCNRALKAASGIIGRLGWAFLCLRISLRLSVVESCIVGRSDMRAICFVLVLLSGLPFASLATPLEDWVATICKANDRQSLRECPIKRLRGKPRGPAQSPWLTRVQGTSLVLPLPRNPWQPVLVSVSDSATP